MVARRLGSAMKGVMVAVLVGVALLVGSCGGDRLTPTPLLDSDAATSDRNPIVGALTEVAPPASIQTLKPFLDVYQPQVRITFPKDGQVIPDTTLAVQLTVRDLPIYKDHDLGLGPHLHLVLDDEPYREVYDLSEPIELTDLAPGTHTLRVFATRPWGESFKTEGAFDQVTFDSFASTPDRNPDRRTPMLIYNEPQGVYGAEPILLDFYLHNAPLHLVAESDDSVPDWRIRCTVNGESFVFDQWQPIYLKGFKPGQNWVKLELIDETGAVLENAFNTAVRVITYQPNGSDPLAKLVRGDIDINYARRLVDPTFTPPAPPVPETPEETEIPAIAPAKTSPIDELLSGPEEEGRDRTDADTAPATPSTPEPADSPMTKDEEIPAAANEDEQPSPASEEAAASEESTAADTSPEIDTLNGDGVEEPESPPAPETPDTAASPNDSAAGDEDDTALDETTETETDAPEVDVSEIEEDAPPLRPELRAGDRSPLEEPLSL
ncbi:MAG: hypothetical protein IGR92_08415 [Leptolyngbyaceae cyanobacterium T60_A2020_046]|nr:hypothetical protein [Leptolyngbyaceae cyanobacterium T60_A2020_046]